MLKTMSLHIIIGTQGGGIILSWRVDSHSRFIIQAIYYLFERREREREEREEREKKEKNGLTIERRKKKKEKKTSVNDGGWG